MECGSALLPLDQFRWVGTVFGLGFRAAGPVQASVSGSGCFEWGSALRPLCQFRCVGSAVWLGGLDLGSAYRRGWVCTCVAQCLRGGLHMRLLYIEFSDCKDVLAEAYRSGDVLRHSRIAPWGSPAVKDLDTIVVRLRSVWGSRCAS